MNNIKIAASILACDFGCLAEETENVIKAGADYIHFDVMDFHFVPNLSFGPFICQTLRNHHITAPIDAHLMVDDPERYIEPFAKAGANLLTFHAEVVKNPESIIDKIQQAGMKAGLAFNPETTIDIPPHILKKLRMILIMSVHPGFAGQSFIESSLEKISSARKLIESAKANNCYLAVDGGIKANNIEKVVKAGADFIVLGSGIFEADDYAEKIKALKEISSK